MRPGAKGSVTPEAHPIRQMMQRQLDAIGADVMGRQQGQALLGARALMK